MERTLHDVGPTYAVRDYMRRMERLCGIPLCEDGEWYNLLMSIVAGEGHRCRTGFRDSLEQGRTSGRMLSVTETATRRMGRPAAEYVMLRAAVGGVKDINGMRSVPGVYVCRDYVRLERDRAELVTSLPFVFFSTHALERIHERDGCGSAGIDDAMNHGMVSADGDLAFATIAGLTVSGENGVRHQLVPFGDGLLVATIVSYLSPALAPLPTVMRQTFKHKLLVQRDAPIRSELAGEMPTGMKGHSSQVLTIVRTYLSSSMLRPEQEEYRRLFMDEAAALDRSRMSAALHMPIGVHEKRGLDSIHASARLHGLLARSISREAYPPFWEAMEKYRNTIPPEHLHGKKQHKMKRMSAAEVQEHERTLMAERVKRSK